MISLGMFITKKSQGAKMLELFLTFAKIGSFTFGGGYAMISLIEDICVTKKKWITHDEMMNMIVIAESTPGPIAINCATFVGYKINGLKGALAATLGVILPSFLIIYIISCFLSNFMEIKIVADAFRGIKLAVGLLIFNAGIGMLSKMKKKLFPIIIFSSSMLLMLCSELLGFKVSTVIMMMTAGLIGLICNSLQKVKK